MLLQKLFKIKQEEGSDEDMDTARSAVGYRERVREMAVSWERPDEPTKNTPNPVAKLLKETGKLPVVA